MSVMGEQFRKETIKMDSNKNDHVQKIMVDYSRITPIYADNIILGSNGYTFSMDILNLIANGAKLSATIKLSPQQALALKNDLDAHIKQYEKNYGKIPVVSREQNATLKTNPEK